MVVFVLSIVNILNFAQQRRPTEEFVTIEWICLFVTRHAPSTEPPTLFALENSHRISGNRDTSAKHLSESWMSMGTGDDSGADDDDDKDRGSHLIVALCCCCGWCWWWPGDYDGYDSGGSNEKAVAAKWFHGNGNRPLGYEHWHEQQQGIVRVDCGDNSFLHSGQWISICEEVDNKFTATMIHRFNLFF